MQKPSRLTDILSNRKILERLPTFAVNSGSVLDSESDILLSSSDWLLSPLVGFWRKWKMNTKIEIRLTLAFLAPPWFLYLISTNQRKIMMNDKCEIKKNLTNLTWANLTRALFSYWLLQSFTIESQQYDEQHNEQGLESEDK
jgi:hypothetical protein